MVRNNAPVIHYATVKLSSTGSSQRGALKANEFNLYFDDFLFWNVYECVSMYCESVSFLRLFSLIEFS